MEKDIEMMNRRDFLKFGAFAIGGVLARYHGATVPGCDQLVQWGKENGVLRPQWCGVDLDTKQIIHGDELPDYLFGFPILWVEKLRSIDEPSR